MKKAYYIILIMLMLQTICITASAKAENQYPQATLTLNDSTVVTGYLHSNLHYLKYLTAAWNNRLQKLKTSSRHLQSND